MGPADPLRFDGQVALVTGAGGGLGRAFAESLAARGARVLVNDLGLTPRGEPDIALGPEASVDAIRAAGGDAFPDRHDVVADPEAIVRAALERWGRIDVVVANAGFVLGGPVASSSSEEYRRMFDVSVAGAAGLMRHAWDALAAMRGRVILLSSNVILGRGGSAPYAAAKSALSGLLRSASREGREPGIRVNGIMPLAHTRVTRAINDRFGDAALYQILRDNFRADQVAAFVVALAHDSLELTGELFTVGGGRAARVFVGVTAGWGSADATPEDFVGRMGEISDPTRYVIPGSLSDEMLWAFEQLGIASPRQSPYLRT